MILICVLAFLALSSGCDSESSEGLDVVATNTIAADIAKHVAGPDADVDTLLPESASPHDFEASAKDRARLEEADVVVAWGGGLEAGVPIEDVGKDPVRLAAGHEDNPHIWMSPTLVARSLNQLAAALAEADPEHTEAYRRRARAYASELTRLDRRVRRVLSPIPPERRKLVSSHDSLGHFVDRYDFEFVGAPFGTVPEAEASAETVAELIDRVESEKVPAVFAEDTDDPELMNEIAREAGVEVVDDLLTEGFGDRVDSYDEMLLYDAERIAGALAQ
jgi:zinc/manganese transport system substrate-binding protein